MRKSASNDRLAYGLGWFSIALGVSEIVAPGPLKRLSGVSAPKSVMVIYGLREILSGVVILSSPRPARWVWLRVAGDVLDLLTLAHSLRGSNARSGQATASFASILAVTMVDLACAAMAEQSGRRKRFGWY